MEDANKKESKKRANEEVEQDATPKKMKSEGSEQSESCVCFVGNLSWNLDEDSLAQVFVECGEVTSVRLITEKGTNRPKGYGYVEFSTPEAAKKALELTGQNVDGRDIRVDLSTPRPPRDNNAGGRAEAPKSTPSATLFMGNLSFDCTEDIIRDTFAEYGSIMSVRLPTDRESGHPKGYYHFRIKL
jgi:nucleolin